MVDVLAGDRVLEAQFGSVQGDSRGPAVVGNQRSGELAAIDLVATEWVSRLGQVNANLVCPARFEPAFDDGVFPQPFDRLDVGDRLFPELGVGGASPTAITAIFDQVALVGLFVRQVARHDGEVDPGEAVRTKLQSQFALGIDRAGEHHQAAGLTVKTVHRPQSPQRPLALRRLFRVWLPGRAPPAPTFAAVDDAGQYFIERRLQLLAAAGPVPLFGMPQRGHSSRLFHDDQVLVEIADLDVFLGGGRRRGKGQQPDHFSLFQSPPLVETEIAVDLDMAARKQMPDAAPRLSRLPGAQQREDGFAGEFGCNVQDLGSGSGHGKFLRPWGGVCPMLANRAVPLYHPRQ